MHILPAVLVIHAAENKGSRRRMSSLDVELEQYDGDPSAIMSCDPMIQPDDNAVIFFTSGTTGLPSKLSAEMHNHYFANLFQRAL